MRRVVVAALALLAFAGCFKDGFLNAGEQDKPTGEKARFIARVDGMCEEANDAASAQSALRAVVEIRQRQLEQLAGLTPPRGGIDQIKYDAFVGAMRNLTTGLEGVALALEINDRAGADKLRGDVDLAVRQVRESAEEYQFDTCRTVTGVELARA